MTNKHMEIFSSSLVIRKMQTNQTEVSTTMGWLKNTDNIKYWQGGRKKYNSFTFLMRCRMGQHLINPDTRDMDLSRI
jgi:hypothetical protein